MAVIETTQIAPPGTWTADPVHSSIGFSVKHMGVATFIGSFNEYAATLVGGEQPRLEGVAKVESIVTQDENLNVHLLSPDFFDADRFPELRFTATDFERDASDLVVRGRLTLRGETRPVELRGTISDPIDDPYGRQRIGLELETIVDRRDFGLDWQAELPSGGDVLGYDVNLAARLSLVKA